MLRYIKSLYLGFLLTLGVLTPVLAADLVAYTGEWAPYNYKEGNAIKGISSDLLRAACHEAKLECELNYVPWTRAYKTVSSTRNSVLYTTARKASREHEFIWVGPILPRTTWVYGRAGLEQSVRTPKDLASLRVGVVRGEAAYQDLQAAGVPESAFVVLPANIDLLRMISRSMIDVLVETEVGMDWNLRTGGQSPDTISKLMKLSDEGGYYFALNLNSDPALAAKLQAAVDQLRRNGTFDSILKKYSASSK
jgi:polar amino acid transport system substrate-binding protein